MKPLPPLKHVPTVNFSERTAPVDLVVIHDCEGSYLGSIAWFAQRRSQVSAHIVLRKDGLEATQMVGLDKKAWHVCGLNSRATGVEIEGFAKDGFGDAELDAAANICAWLLQYHGLPCVWAGNGAPGKRGLTSHYALGPAGGGHSDPSTDPHFPDQFMARVKPYYDGYSAEPLPVWAVGGRPAPHLIVPAPAMPVGYTPTTDARKD